jgi:hypothetical protein
MGGTPLGTFRWRTSDGHGDTGKPRPEKGVCEFTKYVRYSMYTTGHFESTVRVRCARYGVHGKVMETFCIDCASSSKIEIEDAN